MKCNGKADRNPKRVGLLIAACGLLCLIFQASAAAQGTYSITDLGTLGGNNSIPFWITRTGEVVGISDTGQFDVFGNPIDHAFSWTKGVIEDLGTLGGNNSSATGANSEGQAAGIADVTGGTTSHATLWSNGAIVDLGTFSGPSGFSYAQLVNDEQQVAGGSTTADGGFDAALWDRGVITDLGTLVSPPNPAVSSFANGINDLGQVVGGSQVSDIPNPILGFPPFHAVLWYKGAITDLGPGPAPDAIGSAAFNINNKTQVVGRFALPEPTEGAVAHAFLWRAGAMQDLGVPAGLGDDNSEANSLNESGLVVGDSGVGFIETYTPDHALLWRNGEWVDLNTLIPPDSGYYLIVAFDVNLRGQIAAWAVQLSTGNLHAALLTPQPSNVVGSSGASTAATSRAAPPLSENAQRLLRLARCWKSGHKPGPSD